MATLTQGVKLSQGVLKGTNVMALTSSHVIPQTLNENDVVLAQWVIPFPFRILACAYHISISSANDLLNLKLQVDGVSVLGSDSEDMTKNKVHSGLFNIAKPFKEWGSTPLNEDKIADVRVLGSYSTSTVVTYRSFTLFIQPVTD
mgnify:CR=1 FL=1